MSAQETKLKSQRSVDGLTRRKAPCATVMQRGQHSKGPISERAMRGNQNFAGFPSRWKKALRVSIE
jgi:hypothetical protein